MKKIREGYSTEFIEKITENFLSGVSDSDRVSRVRTEIARVRQKNHDALFLEMLLALQNVNHQDSLEASRKLMEVINLDDSIKQLFGEELRLANMLLTYSESKPSAIAKTGGDGRAAKFDDDKAETIRLYEIGKAAGNWQTGRHHVPDAALEITPQIVSFSKGKGNLVATTEMPKTWIKKHIKAQRK